MRRAALLAVTLLTGCFAEFPAAADAPDVKPDVAPRDVPISAKDGATNEPDVPSDGPPDCTPTAEICNGADDDCNGVVDDVSGLGDPCTAGMGACAEPGTLACDLDDGALRCSATARAPQPEQCNDFDDDCDGRTDEEAPGAGEPCTVGRGACERAGLTRCAGVSGLICDATAGEPGFEICDGADDDCNGVVDDVRGLGDPCAVGVGICARDGRLTCDVELRELICDAVPGDSTIETCDERDEDCDGIVDEVDGTGQACVFGVGACAAPGVTRCEGGAVVCAAPPGEPPIVETCNGLDDDCDEIVDEVAGVGDACLTGVGACAREGHQICDLVIEALVCDTLPGAPGDETCNGLDDDCDGEVDDGIAGVGDVCGVGVGACAREGALFCDAQAGAVSCDVRPGPPAEELCNETDDDCDGTVDEVEGLGTICQVGEGACAREGVLDCADQPRPVCVGVAGPPSDEVCNGLDDDCDGVTDELPGVGDPCAVGTGACVREGLIRCDPESGALACDATPGDAADEICNDVDDDCDGVVDDVPGLGDECQVSQGICARDGALACDLALGELVCAGVAGEPAVEICNGLDDDCNGEIDDAAGVGDACVVGVGACRREGLIACPADPAAAVGPPSCDVVAGDPTTEICDGIDNSCSGAVDDQGACGPYVADHCEIWLGWSDNEAGPRGVSETWSDCPASNRDNSGGARCVSSARNRRFRTLDVTGGMDANDTLGIAFRCGDDEIDRYLESHCQLAIGQSDFGLHDAFAGLQPADCPPVQGAANNLPVRCVRSDGDGQFHPLAITGNVGGDDSLALAFFCRDPEDPVRALNVQLSVRAFLGTYDRGRNAIGCWRGGIANDSATWGDCPGASDNDGDARCVGTSSDGLFRWFDFDHNVGDCDQLSVSLLPAP